MVWVLRKKCLLILELRTFPWENIKLLFKTNEELHNLHNSNECACGSKGDVGEWRLSPVAILLKYIIVLFLLYAFQIHFSSWYFEGDLVLHCF